MNMSHRQKRLTLQKEDLTSMVHCINVKNLSPPDGDLHVNRDVEGDHGVYASLYYIIYIHLYAV